MKSILILAALVCGPCVLASAETWRGALVDSDCYQSVTHNVNPTDTSTYVDRDKEWDIRYCSPRPKTNAFTVVPLNGMASFRLDPAGNRMATGLVRKTGKQQFFGVVVSGTMEKTTFHPDSISLLK